MFTKCRLFVLSAKMLSSFLVNHFLHQIQVLVNFISTIILHKRGKKTKKNLSPPSAAYIHQWTRSALVQVTACRQTSDKPLPEPMLTYCELDSWLQIQWKSNRNSIIFIQENAFEIVVCQSGIHFVQGKMTLTEINHNSSYKCYNFQDDFKAFCKLFP